MIKAVFNFYMVVSRILRMIFVRKGLEFKLSFVDRIKQPGPHLRLLGPGPKVGALKTDPKHCVTSIVLVFT